jgi:hypothetical protein
MRAINFAVIIAVLLALPGCALFRSEPPSFVAENFHDDTGQLANYIATLVAEFSPKPDQLRLPEAPDNSAMKALADQLPSQFAKHGVKVAPDDNENAPRLHYIITPFNGGLLLRVRVGTARAALILQRRSGGVLQPATPLVLRKAAP